MRRAAADWNVLAGIRLEAKRVKSGVEKAWISLDSLGDYHLDKSGATCSMVKRDRSENFPENS
jgi:hypothetical protein